MYKGLHGLMYIMVWIFVIVRWLTCIIYISLYLYVFTNTMNMHSKLDYNTLYKLQRSVKGSTSKGWRSKIIWIKYLE